MRRLDGERALLELEALVRRQEEALDRQDAGGLVDALRDGARLADGAAGDAPWGTPQDRAALEALLARSRAVEARARTLRSAALEQLERGGREDSAVRAYARSAGDTGVRPDLDLRL